MNKKKNKISEIVIPRYIYRRHSYRVNHLRRVTQNLLVELMKYSCNKQVSQEHQHLRSKWYLETVDHTIGLSFCHESPIKMS